MALSAEETRVAVIGASGIGKHHAKWWAMNGADVCAIVGSSRKTTQKTATLLHDLFGFEGDEYADVGTMLREEQPDIVDICSPPHLHALHCRAALEAGSHVLCEKPFVFDPNHSRDALVAEAQALTDLARRSGLRLGVCTQYSIGARWFADLWRNAAPDETLRTFEGHLEAPARGRSADPTRVWLDLSPHPISMILELVPGCAVEWDSLELRLENYEATAKFRVCDGSGENVDCQLITRNSVNPPKHVRRCALNGREFRVEGYTSKDGVYGSKVIAGQNTVECEDLLCALIRGFRNGVLPASPDAAIKNLDIMLRILEIALDEGPREQLAMA